MASFLGANKVGVKVAITSSGSPVIYTASPTPPKATDYAGNNTVLKTTQNMSQVSAANDVAESGNYYGRSVVAPTYDFLLEVAKDDEKFKVIQLTTLIAARNQGIPISEAINKSIYYQGFGSYNEKFNGNLWG